MKRDGRTDRRGFTLAELMVVIVILGLLATFVAPNVVRYLTTGKMTKVKADIRALDDAIKQYMMSNSGQYPDSLERLVEPDVNDMRYLEQRVVPKDPWGREYMYDPPVTGNDYRVYTLGKDGIQGGQGEDGDYDQIMLQSGQ